MTTKSEFGWPHAFAVAFIALAIAMTMWAVSMSDEARYNANVENHRIKVEHDQWLLENGHKEIK